MLGERTFGKGIVQSVMDLPYGRKLRITTGSWHTPLGRSLHRERDAGGNVVRETRYAKRLSLLAEATSDVAALERLGHQYARAQITSCSAAIRHTRQAVVGHRPVRAAPETLPGRAHAGLIATVSLEMTEFSPARSRSFCAPVEMTPSK